MSSYAVLSTASLTGRIQIVRELEHAAVARADEFDRVAPLAAYVPKFEEAIDWNEQLV